MAKALPAVNTPMACTSTMAFRKPRIREATVPAARSVLERAMLRSAIAAVAAVAGRRARFAALVGFSVRVEFTGRVGFTVRPGIHVALGLTQAPRLTAFQDEPQYCE